MHPVRFPVDVDVIDGARLVEVLVPLQRDARLHGSQYHGTAELAKILWHRVEDIDRNGVVAADAVSSKLVAGIGQTGDDR